MSSLLKYEVVISEHVGFSAHGQPERGESAGKTHNPGGRRPPGRRGRVVGFACAFAALWPAMSHRRSVENKTGRPCAEISHGEVEAALFREVAETCRFLMQWNSELS